MPPAGMLDSAEKRIAALQPLSSVLDPGLEVRRTVDEAVLDYGRAFLDGLQEAPAYVTTVEKGAGLLDLPIQEEGRPIPDLLEALAEHVDRPGLNPASGGHLGYIPGGGLYPSALGDYLAAISNRYAGIFFASPGAVRMENLLVRWMADQIGYPPQAGGDLTSGGSIANLTGIVTAREAKGIDAASVPTSVIYTSQQVHHCVGKALVIAGLREAQIRSVPLDARYRMDPAALAELIQDDRRAGLKPFLVVASAGTTDTGAVDPLDRIADVAEAEGLWFHVDGAYGGFFMLTPEAPPALTALGRADSVVLDPHKGLFLPYGSGAVLVRSREALYRAHRYEANYMQDTLRSREEPSPADHSPELTRHFRGLRLWLPLQLFGLAPFRACLSEKIWLARYFYERVTEIPFMEVGPYPELSVVLFRMAPEGGDANRLNQELVTRVQEDGRVFLSSTHIEGVQWLRLAVLAFRTRKATVDLALEVLSELVDEIAAGLSG